MKKTINFIPTFLLFLSLFAGITINVLATGKYKGTPWGKHIQKIPGKVQCEFYDLGGEGIAYHD